MLEGEKGGGSTRSSPARQARTSHRAAVLSSVFALPPDRLTSLSPYRLLASGTQQPFAREPLYGPQVDLSDPENG